MNKDPMNEDPIELEPGILGCPLCKIPLIEGKTPCYYENNKLGLFDGIICEMCGYGLLTEKGYEKSYAMMQAFGYISSKYKVDDKTDILYKINSSVKTINTLQHHSFEKKFEMKTGNTSEITPFSIKEPNKIPSEISLPNIS